jgi:ATP-dependent Lon protease
MKTNDVAGVVTGLAWTSVGGDILSLNHCSWKRTMTITGNLGNVMKESATIALEYIKANAELVGINPEALTKHNILASYQKIGYTISKDTPKCRYCHVNFCYLSLTQKRMKKIWPMTGEITLEESTACRGIKEKY